MSTVKTAVSMDKELCERTDRWARQMHRTRSGIVTDALELYLRRLETQAMIDQINEVCADGLDEEDRLFLEAASHNLARIIAEDENEPG